MYSIKIERLPGYTKSAHSQSCVRCGAPNAMPCHYTGPRQHSYGKGRGLKCTDLAIADLCYKCHEYFDQYKGGSKWDQSEEFLHYIFLTIHRRLEQGEVLQFETSITDTSPI